MKITLNQNKEVVETIRTKLKDNDGYCPCVITKSDDSKCMCKNFRTQVENGIEGECHCGLYVATLN